MTSEHMIQAQFVSWFRRTFKGVLIFAIPNGGKRDKKTGGSLKVEGVVSGMPDLYVPEWNLWIEMKKEGGVLSKNQEEIIQHLESVGHGVIVADSLESAIKEINDFIKSRRGFRRNGL